MTNMNEIKKGNWNFDLSTDNKKMDHGQTDRRLSLDLILRYVTLPLQDYLVDLIQRTGGFF